MRHSFLASPELAKAPQASEDVTDEGPGTLRWIPEEEAPASLQGEEEEVQGDAPCAKELSAPVVIAGPGKRACRHGARPRGVQVDSPPQGLLEGRLGTKAAPCGPLGIFFTSGPQPPGSPGAGPAAPPGSEPAQRESSARGRLSAGSREGQGSDLGVGSALPILSPPRKMVVPWGRDLHAWSDHKAQTWSPGDSKTSLSVS